MIEWITRNKLYTCSRFTRCLEIAVHNSTTDSLSFSRYRLINFFFFTLPRYLSQTCQWTIRYFSNGLQRYGLFFILQIFLQYFLHFFALFFSRTTQLAINQPIKHYNKPTIAWLSINYPVFQAHRKNHVRK